MRILFCNFEYPPLGGGGGVINALLAEELAQRHPVTVLTSRGFGLPRDSVEQGVRVLRVPVWARRSEAAASMLSMLSYVLRAPLEGGRHLRSTMYDVINTHFVLPSGPVGDALSRSRGIPNVLSVHGGDLYDPSKSTSPHRHALLRAWIRRLARRADAVVGQSHNTLQNLRRYYTPEIAGRCIPLGIRRPPADRASRESLGLNPDDILMVTVGRLVSRKAVHQLIELAGRLGDPRVRLLVIGSGPMEASLRAQALQLGTGGRVRFLGRLEEADKFRVLHACDLFVSSSQHEGFGIVFLEAMASGLPVICYDHGGQTDFLSDGVTGHLVALNDIPALVDRCARLVRDGELRWRMREHNLRAVEEFYIDRCAKQYEELFEAVIRERRDRPGAAHRNGT